MAKEFFKNLPDTSTPFNASRLNGLLNGNEAMGNIVVGDVRCKNLIPNNATSRTTNGITVTVNPDKSITLSGTATAQILLTLTSSMTLSLPSGTYTFSFGGALPSGVSFEAWHSSATQIVYVASGSSTGNMNITTDLSNFRTQLVISSGTKINTTIKYMLEEGNTDTDYVPYKAFGIESGSNSNGSWVKFEDGTMICRKKISLTGVNINNTWGGLFISSQIDLGDFAQNFKNVPIMSVFTTGNYSTLYMASTTHNSSNAGTIQLVRGTSATDVVINIDVTATGYWK